MTLKSKKAYLSDKSYLTSEFIEKVAHALRETGFVSDEHDFAPYRETISQHCRDIAELLAENGHHSFDLQSGFLSGHPSAGYIYYIYDGNRFGDKDKADRAVGEWLDQKYKR